ncbi:MAG: alpha-amylase family glycosyl hydrolase, partial [Gammaproteobacteria bacterium]
MDVYTQTLLHRVMQHLKFIYSEVEVSTPLSVIAQTVLKAMRLAPDLDAEKTAHALWSEQDVVLVTYGDSVLSEALVEGDAETVGQAEKPLVTLKKFLDDYTKDCISTVHILPFFPYSSDDGFSVMNYSEINQSLGDWSHLTDIADTHRLMADVVINHCSIRCVWFEDFLREEGPGHNFFRIVGAEEDVSQVIRPRTNALAYEVERASGPVNVWCTFSHDQVDFDFRNPDVLIEFVRIIRFYLDRGIRVFRLDAVGFIWKKSGSTCLNLEETHEIVRLLRTVIEQAEPNAILITETNVPHQENLAYFGNANEAHCIYNFSLPPLLLNTLITGDCCVLRQWMMNMPPARLGSAYFNFIASHDGIGLRPAEGLLSDEEIEHLIRALTHRGARVSLRTLENNETRP